ncbi:MAG: discoidin domain-containing protein, partial [Armatimonadia bacterium]
RVRGMWDGSTITRLEYGGKMLPGVTPKLTLIDPKTGQAADPGKFALNAKLTGRNGALWLEGVVTAVGTQDAVVDAVLRFEGVSLPTGNGATDMMLATKLVDKLPIAPLRTLADGQDQLALAMPADKPYVYDFKNLAAEKAVNMRLQLGFSNLAPEPFRMKAPFSIVIMSTNPQWHFRSALAEYYRLFPERFKRIEKRDGGWFFANEVKNIPNPQHYAFFEGQGDLDETHNKGLGMFPYNETGSETIQLAGPGLPKDYADAMKQMNALEQMKAPAAWKLNGGELDETVVHGGKYSYKGSSDSKNTSRHAAQMFMLKEPIKEQVVVSAWSKADKVVSYSGNPNDYSIYVDCLLADGSYMFGQCAVFKPGTHDWEKSEWVIEPKSALVDMRVYAMFRNHTGTAWFDDIRIYRKSKPDENLLENGDFETLGSRRDIRFVHDNALTNAAGEYRVFITDNWGSDVRPEVPLSLLRFICNVNPDLRNPEDRPTPASRGTAFFDTLFQGNPAIDGCYIDGAGAWTCWYMSHRPDHFKFVSNPLSYDPQTFVVGEHGRFQTFKWLRFIQDRYNPEGRTILGNMGPTMDAWTSYTALDIIGIESSIFQDRALMGYHRFGGYHKPVLPMNFVNLHKLDDRATAEEFVLASAQWGEFPSTGRMVREGYQSFGDVCHTYYPALMEMSRAGWEPEPLCETAADATGNRYAAERFGSGEPCYFAVRAPQQGRRVKLTVLPELVGKIKNPVVMDAVQLTPVPAKLTPEGLEVELVDGAEVLTILRVSSEDNVGKWLLGRAAHHCDNAAIVRGKWENTERLHALARDLRVAAAAKGLPALVKRIQDEKAKVEAEQDTLERTSTLYELRDAERAVAEYLLRSGGAKLETAGETLAPVSQQVTLTTTFDPGKSGARMLGTWAEGERNILRLQYLKIPADLKAPGQPLTLGRELPGASHIVSALEVPVAGAAPVIVFRPLNAQFTPVATASVERSEDRATKTIVYKVTVQRLTGPGALTVRAKAAGVAVMPQEVALGAEETVATFRISQVQERTDVIKVDFSILQGGRPVAEAGSEFRNIPMPPPDQLALLSKGAQVEADSTYSGYSPDVTIDGVWETSGLHWTKKAWASQDAAAEDGHWLEITLPAPKPVSQAWIYWAIDNNNVFSSQNYDIELWDGKQWKPVVQVRDNPPSTVSKHTWPSQVTQKVRIHQLKDGGPASRPNIMWVSEVALYNLGTLN